MDKKTDREHLLTHQYKDATNLKDRSQLHGLFSVNKGSWNRWIFDHLRLPPSNRILELGCGPAWLWGKNLDRLPNGWDITVSDFSSGMLQEAQDNLRESQRKFDFKLIDAQAIPFTDETFDTVIANHMLYHVPDRPKALSEMWRVLKANGRFFASTVGKGHMKELIDLAKRADPAAYPIRPGFHFDLESGTEQLSEWFDEVKVHLRDDALIVPEVEPLVTYVLSSNRLDEAKLPEFRRILEAEIASRGPIHITKAAGIFEARKRRIGTNESVF